MSDENLEPVEALTPRQEEILGIVVRTYIRTATPVGSTTIAREHNLGISSATIRNELAHLEKAGYLEQPHTSAGRVPTETGYRYFVTQLMQDAELSSDEQRMIRHQFYQVRMNLEQWMRLTAAVLAHTTQATSLVTAPQATRSQLKYVKLIQVSDALALIVLVLHGSSVRQEMISLFEPISQEDLEMISNKLNALFGNQSAKEISAQRAMLGTFENQVVDRVLDMMRAEDRQRGVMIYRDGLTQLLAQPEFSEPNKVRHLVQVLEEGSLIEPMLMTSQQSNGVQIVIGGEGHWAAMQGYSIILAQYGNLGHVSGALGVLGPLRMPYRRAVSTVRYVSQLLSELMRDIY